MHRILVEEKNWISESRFLHALNYCMLLPGPEAQQLAIYVGWLLNGTAGGLIAGADQKNFAPVDPQDAYLALQERIGEMVVDDLTLILAGLPPQRLQAARPETVGRWRNPPGRSYAPGTRL